MRTEGLYVVDRAVFGRYRTDRAPPGTDGRADLSAYRGIDGTPWSFEDERDPLAAAVEDGLIDVPRLAEIEAARAGGRLGRRTDLLFLRRDGGPEGAAPPGFVHVGVDVGFVGFSCVIHEVLFGRVHPLRAFRSRLNEARLLSAGDAAAFLGARRRARGEGEDLEDARPVARWSVYAPR